MGGLIFDTYHAQVLEEFNWTVPQLRDQRYEAVVHLVTAAIGAERDAPASADDRALGPLREHAHGGIGILCVQVGARARSRRGRATHLTY